MNKEKSVALYEGSVTYSARFPHVSWDAFDVAMGEYPVTRVTLETNEEGTSLQISIHFSGLETCEQAYPITDALADKIALRLGYALNCSIRKPIFVTGGITETRPDGTTSSSSSCSALAGIGAGGTDLHKFGPDTVFRLQQQISQPLMPGEVHYDLYRSLMSTTDTVAKFLALYLVLMSFHDDKQGRVDKFIRASGLPAPTSLTGPAHKGGTEPTEETVYTRLRNQIGHNRGKTLRETEAEMGTHIGNLMEIVKKCLEENG